MTPLLTPADLDRLVAETFIDAVDYHDELDSTNTRAAAIAAAASPTDRSTILILADRQSAGRGRGANAWWSADGALTFSILLREAADRIPTDRWPLLSLAAGLAVCRAVDQLFASPQSPVPSPQLKWPNDVYLDSRKLGGILIESATGKQGNVIVGIGLNVNNSAATAPPELREKIVALADAAPAAVRRADLLNGVLKEFAAGLAQLIDGADDLPEEFARRSFLTGRSVEIELATGLVAGICQGIDQDGALLIATASGSQRILSGTVIRFD